MLRLLAGALALAIIILAPDGTARAASGPLVTGKCWCAIGWGRFMADCGSKRVTCTKPMCAAACQARVPAKTSAAPLTDISAARRVRHQTRHDVDGWQPRSDFQAWDAEAPRPPAHEFRRMWSKGAWRMALRRHYAGRGRVQAQPYAQRVQTAAIAGVFAGGAAATLARPRDCYGIQWCGCWLRHSFGIADRSLNLAINWARVGSSASPESANVVVWRHHVGRLLAHENGRILIQSGNDRGAVRTRWVSPHILGGVVAWRRV
jgi:hypothetical protein